MKRPKVAPKDPDFVTSLERGLKVLSVFSNESPELTLTEAAQKTHLSPATARRFLRTLESLGYVGTAGKRFLLRPKVLEVGYAYLSSMSVDEILQPYLREIVQQTGDSSSVTVLEGTEIVYIANAQVKRLVRLSAGVGRRFPAYPTAMGRVLLAYQTPAQLKEYFRKEKIKKITEFTETDVTRLKEILEGVRKAGYAVVQDELEVGLVSVAVPLTDANGDVIAAMNCSAVARRTDSEEMVRTRLNLLLEYAGRISVDLRGSALAHSVKGDSSGAVRSKEDQPGSDSADTGKARKSQTPGTTPRVSKRAKSSAALLAR